MRSRLALALLLPAALAACGRSDEGNEAARAPDGAIVSPQDEANVVAAPNGAEAASQEVPLDALAGVRIGATIAQLRAQGRSVEKDDGPDPDNRCGYARIADAPDMFFMLDGDRVVRIDVAVAGHPTLGGVEVGMSETEAVRRLGKRVRVLRALDRGAAAHDFVVHEPGAAHGLVLETDGVRVTSYRIGAWDAVRAKEECL